MPDMLVHVAPELLAALRGDPAERWTIRRGELLAPDLLGPADWSLYVATVRAARVHVVAYLERVTADRDELGDATTCDVDITPLLDRLGCSGGTARFAAWAARPRVLTRTDADLLRYRLGLPLDVNAPPPLPPPPRPPAPPPAIELADDAAAMDLLAAVYEDLDSDSNRMVLADRLIELGDPRGEMIALQLARARTGAPATPRERELIAQHGLAWTKPLSKCFLSYGFRRGFLATAVLDDRTKLSPAWYEHPAWATVEELETGNATLLLSPSLRSLRRVAIPGAVLETLAHQAWPLAIESIVGTTMKTGGPSGRLVQGGVGLPLHGLPRLGESTALERLSSMSISIEGAALAGQAEAFLVTRLGLRVEHVELFNPHLVMVEPERWRRVFEHDRRLSCGLRGVVDDWLAVIVRQRGSITVQLGDPAYSRQPSLRPILPLIEALGRGFGSITLERVGEDRFGIDPRPAAEELRSAFAEVRLVAANRWRSP